jgi:hypothetical protein
MSITIDKGVPLPKRRGRRVKSEWREWPFDRMAVGDSFFARAMLEAHAARTASQEYMSRFRDVLFETRATDCDEITKLPGVRVWRIK